MKKAYSIKGIIQKANKKGLAPLYVRYIYDRKPIEIPVGVSVPVSDFNTDKGIVYTDRPNAEAINSKIRVIVDILSTIADSLSVPERYAVKEAYYIKVEQQRAEHENKAARQKIAASAKRGVRIVNEIELDEAVSKKEALTKSLSEVDAELDRLKAEGFIDISGEEKLFRKLLAEYPEKFVKNGSRMKDQMKSWSTTIVEFSDKTKTPLLFSNMNDKFYTTLGKYLFKEKEYYNGTFGQCVKRLKTFLNYVRDEHKINANTAYKKWKILEDEPTCEYLTDEEIDLLYNDYRSSATPAQQRLIDVMVFQSLCGFRYSDVRASKWKVVKEVLIGYPKKQNKKQEGKNVKPYQIPFILDARIKEILERYNYNMDLIVDQDYNRDMKTLLQKFFDHYKINQVEVTYYKYRFQEEHKFTKPKYKLFASHSCRRGFINRWSKKFDDSTILRMLGSSSLKELQRYKNKSTDSLVSIIESRLQAVPTEKVKAEFSTN